MAPEKTAKRKAPSTVADFIVLPLTLPTLSGLPAAHENTTHYLYVKPHEPSTYSATAERSLFIANVPIDASESNIRALFAEQLGGARVESVDFDASVPARPLHKRWKQDKRGDSEDESEQRSKKRKRTDDVVAEGVIEDDESALPALWARDVQRSGSAAVVTFVDKRSARGALKEVHAVAKSARSLPWKTGGPLGLERYKSHLALVHPSPASLQSSINAYLSQFTALETQRARLLKHARTVPDADGFVTVARGGRAGPARIEDAERKKAELEERRKNNGVKDDFYRFQNREKRKEAEVNLRIRFEEDRRRVQRMRERRGRVRPEA
ncbi:ribosomal RNA-processing protein 7-domain-containing protein [Boeremia exigua]|uniref:ribosomal RNA-processing protein 7-domain-containing protein n=1 Tax=Boeremia exigua TaxID=749465 RepID=UPI001E8D9CBE|nr:ribosomal RNA-processing protein 7-domain-containing protein [Boeremia exigua]KAH6642881.1 ribosomal RNA-processing protein 7-domain-containing protein [Boeremia exigua]